MDRIVHTPQTTALSFNLFFGLWLVPMGWVAATSGRFPRALGWILVAGGVGYVASAFVDYAVDAPTVLVDALAIPATVGELWMIGYLLVVGIRPVTEGSRARRDAGVRLVERPEVRPELPDDA